MAKRQWLWAAVVSAAAILAPSALRRADAQDAAGGQPAGVAEADAGDDLRREADALNARRVAGERPGVQDAREEAARRIVRFFLPRSADARTVLLAALRNNANEGSQRAVALALAEEGGGEPDPEFIPALRPLVGRSRETSGPAAMALANYKGRLAQPIIADLADAARNRPTAESVRAGIVRAMGRIVEQEAGRQLVPFLSDDSAVVRNAACDALADLTSLNYGHDPARWQAWWDREGGLPAGEWQVVQLRRGNDRKASLAAEKDRTDESIRVQMTILYRSAPDAQRPDIVLRFLQDPAAPFRRTGANLVKQDALQLGAAAVGGPVKARLRSMIGDSAAAVRRDVADALAAINDEGAVPALLGQLAVEPDNDVRVAIAAALGPTGSARAVGPLLELLGSASLPVAESAARALSEETMSRAVRADPALVNRAAAALAAALNRTNGTPGTGPLREAITRAIASLHASATIGTLIGLKSPSVPANTPGVRRAAVAGLGLMDDERAKAAAAPRVAESLNPREERDKGVRLEAARALGGVGSAANADALYQRLRDPSEDGSVKSAAWASLSSLFYRADFPVDQLNSYVDQIRRDYPAEPDKWLAPLQALRTRLADRQELDALAAVNQDIADAYLRLGKPAEALPFAREALDRRIAQNVPDAALQPVLRRYTQALLQSHRYADAVQLANQQAMGRTAVTDRMAMQGVFGEEFSREVKRLYAANDPTSLKYAAELVEAVKSDLDPALSGIRDFVQRAGGR